MRILYVFRSLAHWGGIERILVDKMNQLATMYSYEIYMLTTDQGSHPVPYQLASEVHLEDLRINFHHQYRYGFLKRLLIAKQKERYFERLLSERLKAINPDVIVCTTANHVDINVITKLKGDIPLIVESHSIYRMTLGQKGLRNRYTDYKYRKGLSKAQMIVALTEGDAEDWRKDFSNVCVIPDMVHLNEGGLSSLKNKRVIWVGRFDYQKRPMEILIIWQMVIPHFPDWHLDIYGEGMLQLELENVVKSLNMNIHIHKPTDHIFEAYSGSSMLLSTSLFEPFGLVLPEAMSCGLPVVAYDCPYGPADIITDGVDGFLIRNRDIHAFADKVCQLIEDEDLRHRMGQNGIVSSQRYRADVIMPKWVDLFQKVLSSQ